MIDDRLSVSITKADGSVKRWGPDEPNARDVPADLSFGTSIPGGDKDMTCSLLRRIDVDYSDQALFDHVRVYGPGNRTVWQGRMVQFPRDHGDSFGIQPAAVGLSAHLKDDPSFQEIYVDRDLTRWNEWFDLKSLRAGTFDTATLGFSSDTGGIMFPLPNSAVPPSSLVDCVYQAPSGLKVGDVQYVGTQNIPAGYRAPEIDFADSAADMHGGGPTYSSVAATLDGNLRQAVPSTARRYVDLLMYANAVSATPTAGMSRQFTKLAVFGTHGLNGQTVASGEPEGLYAGDIIANIVSRAAPLLNYTTGTGGSIERTTFAIPHMVFLDPTTAEDAILTVNAYHLYDWGVYDGLFFYRQPNPDRLTWQARLSDGAKLSLEGDTAEQVYNGVYVTYTDPIGAKKTVGPPGATADATDPSLADTSSTNPVNAHGIPKRWGRLDLSIPTTAAGAIQLGYVWLQERSLASRRGQVTLTGDVTHPTEGKVPAWRVRAGDWISIADHPSSAPRKIIETSYSHGTRTVTCTLDNTVAKTEAILERLGVLSIGRF